MRGRRLTTVGLLLLPVSLVSQQPPPQDWSGPPHREFDFWIGEWEVTSSGRLAGTNSITLTQGGLHSARTGEEG